MEINAQQLIENAIRDGLRDGIKSKMSANYNNPLDKLIESCISAKSDEFRALLNEGLASCLSDEDYREELKSSVRHALAKTLIHKFGGEIEKSVNALKSDPTTRARITIAIEEIVKAKTA